MADARRSTPRNRIDLPRTGEGVGVWASYGVNGILSTIDEALDGVATVTGDALTARVGSSDDLRRRVWNVVGGAREILVPDFAGLRLVRCAAAGVVLRASTSTLVLPAGLSMVHMMDGRLVRVADRSRIETDVPTAGPLKARRLSFLSTIVDADLPVPSAGDWIVAIGAAGGSTVRGSIRSSPFVARLTSAGAFLSTGGRRIAAGAWRGDVASVRIEAGRSARFVADGARWLQC